MIEMEKVKKKLNKLYIDPVVTNEDTKISTESMLLFEKILKSIEKKLDE